MSSSLHCIGRCQFLSGHTRKFNLWTPTLTRALTGLVHEGRSVIIYVYTHTHRKPLSILHLDVHDYSVYKYSVPSNTPHTPVSKRMHNITHQPEPLCASASLKENTLITLSLLLFLFRVCLGISSSNFPRFPSLCIATIGLYSPSDAAS